MISNYKVKVNDSCNYKVSITDIQNKYKFKLFCAGADLTDYYTKEQVDQSQNTQDILIDNLLNQIPTGTATGETINITDSSSLPLKDIQEAGNTYQADAILPNEYTQVDYIESSGTQYIDTGFKPNQNTRMIANVYINSLVGQYNNIGGTRASNTNQFHIIIASDRFDARYGTQGSNISYTTTGLFNFDFNKNQLYINNSLAHTFTDTTFSSDYNAYIFAVNNTGSASQMADYKLYNMKWYDNDTLVRDFIPCYRNSDNVVGLYDLVNNVFYVNKGTGSFTYGSVASIPNPDYPQAITNVTETNTIKIVGKNLFDKSNVNVLNAYFTATSPTITSSSSDRTIYIPCEPNTTYTISKNLVGYGRAVGYTSTIPAISSSVEGTINISANNTSGTITTGANANYLVMRAFNTGQDTLTYQQVLDSIQIEKSSTVTTYEAYKEKSYTINLGSIELCKIGDYKDRIYYSSGKWYLEKNIGKVTITGNDITAINTNQTNTTRAKTNNDFINTNQEGIGYSNYFQIVSNWGIDTIGLYYSKTNGDVWFRANKTLIGTTLESVQTWVNSHNVTLYYLLATPTTTEITDTTLVSQLDALLNSTTYKTTTNITIDTTNQKPTLTLTYRKDLETLIGG